MGDFAPSGLHRLRPHGTSPNDLYSRKFVPSHAQGSGSSFGGVFWRDHTFQLVFRAVERASGLTAFPFGGAAAVETVVCQSLFCGLLHVEGDGGNMLHGPTRSRYRDAIVLRLCRGATAATTSGETRECRSGEEKDCERQFLQPLR